MQTGLERRLAQALALHPAQGNADVSRDSIRKIDDLEPQFIAARLQIFFPEIVSFFRQAGQRVFQPGSALLIARP